MRKFFSIAGGRKCAPPGGVTGVGSARNTRRMNAGLQYNTIGCQCVFFYNNWEWAPYVSGVASMDSPSLCIFASSALSSDS